MKSLKILLLLISTSAYAQKIKVNEIDKFTKQRRIETSEVKLKEGFLSGISFYYRSVDSIFFIINKGYGDGVGIVTETTPLLFLLDNDSTVSIYPTSTQSYIVGTGKVYAHQYSISKEIIEVLAVHKIKSVRKYLTDSYADIEIPKKDRLQQLSILFLATIKNNQ